MRYLLIDKIKEIEVKKKIYAIKNIALSEDIFVDHFFGFPVMPGAMLIECLAQAGTALLEVSYKFKKKALLVIVEQAKFRSLIRPGDQLSIEGELISLDSDSAQMEGKIKREDMVVMTARLIFALREANEFYPEKTRHLMQTVYDIWLREAKIKNLNT